MSETKPLLPGDPESIGAYRLTGPAGRGRPGGGFLGRPRPAITSRSSSSRLDGRQQGALAVRARVDLAKKVARFCTAQVLDADVDGDRPYIVSEYVPGRPAGRRRRRGALGGAELDRLASAR